MASKESHGGILPKDASASDWDGLGDLLESHLLAEAEKLSIAKVLTKSKSPSDESAMTDWSYLYSEDDIAVFRKKTDDCCFVGEGMIDVPLHQVAELVKDIESSYIWEKFLVEAHCLKVLSASESCIDYIGYERFQTSGCLYTFRRDMLYFNRCVYRDGRYIQSQVSVEDPGCPLREKTPRIDVKKGTGFILEPYKGDDSKTLAAFYFNINLKGLPRFIKSRIVRTYPLVIRDIRQYLSGPGILESLVDNALQCQPQDSVVKRTSRTRAHTSTSCSNHRTTEAGSDGETCWRSGIFSMQYDEPMPLDHYIKN